MQQLIRDIQNETDAIPGRCAWTFGVHCYAVDMFSEYIGRMGLDIWDESAGIGKITEEDLLDGAKDWLQYSRDGNSLVYNKDICCRLCNRRDQERTQDGKLPPDDHEDWLDFQAGALQQAAQIVIKAVNRRGKAE